MKADPAQEAIYRRNAAACREELRKLTEEFAEAKKVLAGEKTVVFHEGFVYLFRMLGIETVHCLAMDSDTQIAAGEAAEILEECKRHGISVLFAEAEYAQTVEDTFAGEISGEVLVLDPVTGAPAGTADGTYEADGYQTGVALYCEIMRNNLDCIKQAYGLQ